ncbi:large ribosomal subunit protein uL2-like [Miscanthus floridulus]|uniref:large ribosomal subunit protein uL2-like n=1 Tax=Miscanthus floridulus TaxID=154761 RepID=UPI00345A5112
MDQLDEAHDIALLRLAKYQQTLHRYHSRWVWDRAFNIIVSDQFYYEYYCGRRATLSIGDVLPLHGILEGAVIYNIEHHVGNYGASTGASMDYAIMTSHSPDNDTSAGASRNFSIVISCNRNSGTFVGTSRESSLGTTLTTAPLLGRTGTTPL